MLARLAAAAYIPEIVIASEGLIGCRLLLLLWL